MQDLIDVLLQQAPLVIFMGGAIWWLVKMLVKSDIEKQKLTESVVKLTTLWEEKTSKMSHSDEGFKKEALKLLTEIRALILKN